MLHINLNDLTEPSASVIAQAIEHAYRELRVTMAVRDQYKAMTRDLAFNWLKSWYIAESLAEATSRWKVTFGEGDNYSCEFEFRFTVNDPKRMATRIVDLAAVFDEDDQEAGAMIYDEADDWLNRRGRITRFPELEKCYRDDAMEADEHDQLNPPDDHEDL